jgi:hypothetical protein
MIVSLPQKQVQILSTFGFVGGITGFIPDAITTIICIAIQINNRGF